MSSLFFTQIPNEVRQIIYEYDDTYRTIFTRDILPYFVDGKAIRLFNKEEMKTILLDLFENEDNSWVGRDDNPMKDYTFVDFVNINVCVYDHAEPEEESSFYGKYVVRIVFEKSHKYNNTKNVKEAVRLECNIRHEEEYCYYGGIEYEQTRDHVPLQNIILCNCEYVPRYNDTTPVSFGYKAGDKAAYTSHYEDVVNYPNNYMAFSRYMNNIEDLTSFISTKDWYLNGVPKELRYQELVRCELIHWYFQGFDSKSKIHYWQNYLLNVGRTDEYRKNMIYEITGSCLF
jgi:hypothetical protein